jgi:ABC-2 type transport system permease protein
MPIYDQSFRRYTGPRHTNLLWWAVAWQTMRPILRSKLTYLLLAGVVIPLIVFSVGFFVAAQIEQIAPEHTQAAAEAAKVVQIPLFGRHISFNTVAFQFIMGEMVFLWILVLANGGGLISKDRRFSALPLYFSRPLTIPQYMAGKVLGLAMFPAAIMLLSILLLYIQTAAYFYTIPETLGQLHVLARALGFIVVASMFMSLAMAGFSSVSKNSNVAGVAFILFWMLTGVMAQAVRHETRVRAFAAMSPLQSLQMLGRKMLSPDLGHIGQRREWREFDVSYAVVALAAYSLLFLFLRRRNLRVVEVVK